jgi:hypothetical protein
MTRIGSLTLATVLVAGGAVGAAGLFAGRAPNTALPSRPVWIETAWPFPLDPWGKGKAFHCRAEHCGADIKLYIRAKIGACGCVAAIDDEDLDRVVDVDLIGPERASLGPGRPIEVRWAKARMRPYTLSGRGATARSALAIALHERCDLIVATAAVSHGEPVAHGGAVLEFLNSDTILGWAEVTLGL